MKIYYSFRYAFHVRQGKMRKAAAVMHEQVIHLLSFLFFFSGHLIFFCSIKALRYGSEGEASQMVKCLLACLNALRLVSREEAWLVKPVQSSSNRSADQRTVDVIEYADIEKEYELSYACLNLGQCITSLSPPDVVALLTSKNRYESALRIARIFDVKGNNKVTLVWSISLFFFGALLKFMTAKLVVLNVSAKLSTDLLLHKFCFH